MEHTLLFHRQSSQALEGRQGRGTDLGGSQEDEVFVVVLLIHGGRAPAVGGLGGQQLGLVHGLRALEGQLVGGGGPRGSPIVQRLHFPTCLSTRLL